MALKNYYEILGFSTRKVSTEQIKNAYREQAKKYHPDINLNDSISEEKFKDVNEAYRVLSDEKQRRNYDISWIRNFGISKNKEEVEEKKTAKEFLYGIFFGDGKNSKGSENIKTENTRGEDVYTDLRVSIKEAFFGTQKQLTLKNSKGEDIAFNIKIPAGIQNQEKIRIVGQGKPGKDPDKNGDLLVRVNIANDRYYSLVGNDIYTKIALKPYELTLGARKELFVLGEKINLIIPSGSTDKSEFIIKEKGYKGANGIRGNLHIRYKIMSDKKIVAT